MIFINHRIIPQSKYIFQASSELYQQSQHHKVTQFVIHIFKFAESKYVITKSIIAFNIIEKSILMFFFIKYFDYYNKFIFFFN